MQVPNENSKYAMRVEFVGASGWAFKIFRDDVKAGPVIVRGGFETEQGALSAGNRFMGTRPRYPLDCTSDERVPSDVFIP